MHTIKIVRYAMQRNGKRQMLVGYKSKAIRSFCRHSGSRNRNSESDAKVQDRTCRRGLAVGSGQELNSCPSKRHLQLSYALPHGLCGGDRILLALETQSPASRGDRCASKAEYSPHGRQGHNSTKWEASSRSSSAASIQNGEDCEEALETEFPSCPWPNTCRRA